MEEPKPDQPMPPTEPPNPNPPTEPPNPNPPPTEAPNPNPDPKPPNSAPQTLPPQPPSSSLPPNPRKRPLDNDTHIHNSSYFKMRAVLKDLRPHFIEVLRTPDFKNCKAALEIREQMKLLMDLYKEMTAKTITIPGGRLSSGDSQDGKAAGQPPPPEKGFVKPSEPVLLGRTSEKLQPDGTQILGTYIIGGSAFGWNFITFPGNKAVYYGRTKEAFRAANVIPPP